MNPSIALNSDSVALDAPLELSATRLLDREDSTVEVTPLSRLRAEMSAGVNS